MKYPMKDTRLFMEYDNDAHCLVFAIHSFVSCASPIVQKWVLFWWKKA